MQHVSLRNKQVIKIVRWPDCLCKNKCFSLLSNDNKDTIMSLFNIIADTNTQDTYLIGLLDVQKVVRHLCRQGNRKPKTCSVKYKVKVNNSNDNKLSYY